MAEAQARRELDLANLSLSDRAREIESLNEKVRILERNHSETVADLKKNQELMRRSQLDREIQELTLKHQTDRQLLENQIRMYAQKNSELENNSAIVLMELDKMNKLQDERFTEIENYKLDLMNADRERHKLTTDNEQLRQTLQQTEISY